MPEKHEAKNRKIVNGRRCAPCGTYDRFDDTGECVGCYNYRMAIAGGRFKGIDNRKPKTDKPKVDYSEN